VKFLIDHQLPPALAHFFETHGHFTRHVRDIGLKEATDASIWNHALKNQMVVVSKDEDFYFLVMSLGNMGKLIWVRMGNCRKHVLLDRFQSQLPHIIAAFEAGSDIVEIR
jgi:predicted nuclease of predicted toxin-antitoxin system